LGSHTMLTLYFAPGSRSNPPLDMNCPRDGRLRRHTPRKPGIQYAAASRFYDKRSGILDHPPSRVMTTEDDCRENPVSNFVCGAFHSQIEFNDGNDRYRPSRA
jgi:hypothetical protein